MKKFSWFKSSPVIVVLALAAACIEGGSNPNQKGVGDQPGGVKLGIGDIAVAPYGDYVVFRHGDLLAAGLIDSAEIRDLPVESPDLLAFSSVRSTVYVSTKAGFMTSSRVLAVDIKTGKVLWSTTVGMSGSALKMLVAGSDGRFIIAASERLVEVLDAVTGVIRSTIALKRPLVDFKILPDNKRALVVEEHELNVNNAPRTRLTVIQLETGETKAINVPNCSDDVVVSADGQRAFLAPTTCSRDPVSVIELSPGDEKFSRNLPGFGPVALSPDGSLAVAFLDSENIDVSLFDEPADVQKIDLGVRYHLMIIDPVTLRYDFAPVGESLPRFAITPDGNVLLVDSFTINSNMESLRLFDVKSRSFRQITGDKIFLNNFVITSDSAHAYALMDGLYDIDITAGRAKEIVMGFTPVNINISADDKLLFLRKDDCEICIFEIEGRTCLRSFNSKS
ncbi:MAG: hypothetical protein WC889_19095 [Myxococcota bacterium]|jgi:outer membrane protein assembly factor BamB